MTDASVTPDDDPFVNAFSAVLRETPHKRQLINSPEQGSLKAARMSGKAASQPATLPDHLSSAREFKQPPRKKLPWSINLKAIHDKRMLRQFDHVVLSRIPNRQYQMFCRNIVARCRRGHPVTIGSHFAGIDFGHNASQDCLR